MFICNKISLYRIIYPKKKEEEEVHSCFQYVPFFLINYADFISKKQNKARTAKLRDQSQHISKYILFSSFE